MKSYIAIIHKEPGGSYGVSFPDLPGCITAGDTLDEARTLAIEALAFHLEDFADHDEAVPEPSSLETVMADPNNRDGVVILVDAPQAPARVLRLNITLPGDLVETIDAYAEANGLTRSGFLARAAKRELQAV